MSDKTVEFFVDDEFGEEFFLRLMPLGYGRYELRKTPARFYDQEEDEDDGYFVGDIPEDKAQAAPWDGSR